MASTLVANGLLLSKHQGHISHDLSWSLTSNPKSGTPRMTEKEKHGQTVALNFAIMVRSMFFSCTS